MNILVRFHRGIGAGAALSRGWTQSHIGHCDLLFLDDTVLDVRPGRAIQRSLAFDVPESDIIRTVPLQAAEDGMDCLSAWLNGPDVLGQQHDGYGAAVAGLPFLAREHEEHWFSAEACSRALQIAGVLSYRVTPWRQTPHSLYELLPPA